MKIKNLLLVSLVAVMLSACDGTTTTSSNTSNGGDITSGTGTSELSGPVDDGYYSSINWDFNQGQMLLNLHNLMMDTHHTYVHYSSYWSYNKGANALDLNPDNPNQIVRYYTGMVQGNNGSSGATREHVWPCAKSGTLWNRAYGFESDHDQGGGGDLHHVRPASSNVNTARGSGRFSEFEEGETCYQVGDSGPYKIKVDTSSLTFASRVEVVDEYKGDTARIVTYLYLHYNSSFGKSNQYTGSLDLKDVIDKDTHEEVYETLKEWNELDPVDEGERIRNENAAKIQGNRNPFIDYPEFMNMIF